MFRRTSFTPAPLALWAAQALGWSPPKSKTPFLTREWLSERDNMNPNWRDAFNELAPAQPELPPEPDDDKPLNGLTIAVADDLDVDGFVSTFGVEPTMFHTRPTADQPFVTWLRERGAFVVGKTKTKTPFARTDLTVLSKQPAATAVSCRSCDIALTGSILGPAAVSAPISADVFAFKPSAAALPHFVPPFSRRYSIGLVTRHLGVAERLWQEMVGKAARKYEMDSIEDEEYILRPIPDYMIDSNDNIMNESSSSSSKSKSTTPTLKVGVPVEWIDQVLQKPGAGEALSEGLQSKMKAKVKESWYTKNSDNNRVLKWIKGKMAKFGERIANRAMRTKKQFEDKSTSFTTTLSSSSSFSTTTTTTTTAKQQEETTKPNQIVDIEVQSINFGWNIGAVIDVATIIINYELSRAFHRRHLDKATGVLDQLPPEAVNAIYSGNDITEKEYESAVAQLNILRQDLFDEMKNVDCFCLPLLAPPFQDGNLRSLGFCLPFALIGCSFASFRLPLPSDSKSSVSKRYSKIKQMGVLYEPENAMEDVADLDSGDYKNNGFRLVAANRGEVFSGAGTPSPSSKSGITASSVLESSKSNTSSSVSDSSSISNASVVSSSVGVVSVSKSKTKGVTLPIVLIAEPGQDTIIFEAARSLLQREE